MSTQVEEPTIGTSDERAEVLPILPLKDTVVFPDSMTPLAIGQERSVRLVDEAVANDRTVALVTSTDPEKDAPGADDLHRVGTAAEIHKMIRVPDGTLRILVQGIRRIRLEEVTQEEPFLEARFVELPDIVTESKEVEALTRNVEALFARIVELVPY